MPMPRRSAAWSISVPAVQGQDVSRGYWACAPLILRPRLQQQCEVRSRVE